jgi:hypothetical protein
MDDPRRAIQNEVCEFRSVIEGGDRRHCGAANNGSDYVFRRVPDTILGFSKARLRSM